MIPFAFAYEGDARMTAGALERWTLRFIAQGDIPAGARIGIAHRWPSDWGIAQANDPARIDYLEAEASAGKSLRWWNARLHAWHPFDHILFVEACDGLAAGDSVALRYGDGRKGSPGFRVQTFIEEASPFSLRWQPAEGAPWVEFARHTVAIVGAEPDRLVVTAPSRAASGLPFDVHLRVEDRWGNPATLDAPLSVALGAREVTVPQRAWTRVSMTLPSPGVHRIDAHGLDGYALAATTNPIDVAASARAERLYWGDLHAQSVIGCGARSIDAYYAHARDFAAADFGSHQANCFLVSNGEWRETQASTERHHAAGRFVTLLGVEWSGASNVGGDHNLYFPGAAAELRRCSHEFVADKSDADTDLAHVEDVYRHYRGTDTLIAVHVGGRTADLRWYEPDLDRLLEVHSTHATSEWFLFEALRRGYRMGVIAGSDSVDGRPGNSHPGHMGVRNVRGGLTAIYAPELTRDAVWQALRKRRCYATTGERILLDFRAGPHAMGDTIHVSNALRMPAFDVRVEGTAPLEQIDFFRGTACLQSVDCFARTGGLSNRLRVAWRGLSAPGNWQRARMSWDGELRIEGARIIDVRGWSFDTPDEGLREHDETRVRWRSVTAGDWDGIELTLDRREAELAFVTEPMTLRTALARLPAGGRRFDAQSPERSVELRWLPEHASAPSFDGQMRDPSPPAGEHAYWVRVRQSDGAYAWSSPIFVSLER